VNLSEQLLFPAGSYDPIEDGGYGSGPIGPSPGDGDRAGTVESTVERGVQLVNEWLLAVADYLSGLVVAQLSKIRKLSPTGKMQLLVDLNYLR